MSPIRFAHGAYTVYDANAMRSIRLRFDPYLLLLLGLSLFALSPLLAPGYFYSAHDGRHSVFYVTMFDEAIRSGALWPRWAMHHNQGYGYPTFLVQAPLSFYVAEFFVLLGVGITQAVKIGWALGFLGGAWGMYSLVRNWLLEPPGTRRAGADQAGVSPGVASMCGVVAGLLYTYAPYHLLDIYVRAAYAETMLLAWFPWVFLAFYRLITRGMEPGWQGRLAVAALSYAGLLLTHSFALVAFTPLLAGFVLLLLAMTWWETRLSHGPTALVQRTLLAAAGGVAGGLMAAAFLIPLLLEGPLLVQEEWTRDTYNYTRHWVHWGQFFSPFWGYGYSDDPSGANDGMGFQLGALMVFLMCAAGYLLFSSWTARTRRTAPTGAMDGRSRHLWLMAFLLGASLALLASMTPAAAVLWGNVPMLDVIQFPWRLLGLVIFCASALGGLAVGQAMGRAHALRQPSVGEEGLLVMALLICLAGIPYSRPAALQPVDGWREDGRAVMEFEREHPDMIATTQFVDERTTQSPMTDQYLAADYSLDALARFAVTAGQGSVVRQTSLGHAFSGEVEMAEPGTLQIRLYAFPGWQVKVNGDPVPYRVSPPYGLMEIDLPAGQHQVEVWMGTTPPRTIGAVISWVSLLVVGGLWLYGRRAHTSRHP